MARTPQSELEACIKQNLAQRREVEAAAIKVARILAPFRSSDRRDILELVNQSLACEGNYGSSSGSGTSVNL